MGNNLIGSWVEQSRISALEVHRIFSTTKHGRTLSMLPRYARFKPEKCSLAVWRQMVGPNALVLDHLEESLNVALDFLASEYKLSPGKYTAGEWEMLCVAAICHDHGEAIMGDVAYGFKNKDDFEKERELLATYESEFVPGINMHLLSLYRSARDHIIFSPHNLKLAGAHASVEHIGYMNDALRVITMLDTGQDEVMDADTRTQLRRMYIEIFSNGVLTKLIQLGGQHPSALAFIHKHQNMINKAVNGVRADDFLWYADAEENGSTHWADLFRHHKVMWNNWHGKVVKKDVHDEPA